jgi:hypothetical protein
MESAQKAIMIGVGLFITIIIIAAVMTITGIGQDLLNQGQSQLSGISGQLQSQLQAQYDQVTMSGTLVKSAVNKYYNDPTVVVALYNQKNVLTNPAYVGAADVGTATLVAVGTTSSTVSGFTVVDPTVDEIDTKVALSVLSTKNLTPDLYIEPTGQYKSVLIRRSDTASVLGVAFVRYQ